MGRRAMPVKKASKIPVVEVISEPVFEVTLSGGMANRHRLPLSHVISVLQRLQEAIREVGKVIQRENGNQNPDGDFGIELLATTEGVVFSKGSIRSSAAITKDLVNGKEAIRRVMKTANSLEKRRPSSISVSSETIVPKLAAVADIQKIDQTKLGLALVLPKQRKPESVTFGESGIQTIEAMVADEVTESGLTVYGRLRRLSDRSVLEEGGDYFWGDLVKDNKDVWRARFPTSKQDEVVKLFRKRVAILGDVTYFRTQNPSIDVSEIRDDPLPDYETAFDELYGCDEDIYGKDDFDTLIGEMRGES